ncbi:bactofilin family protein [Aquimarina mytili]|uniref:Polymer-forming cytoskeletal protein n=1 Tax=Aquimarina mytili TaxID=874423 RepID=A0A936ZRR1_9FLAO|nr:hypothetical protein [Aquimarina mytili]MBL0684197.1 hypothetical protein [Aquimarina mytili]
MIFFQKIKAQAMQFAILISVLVALVLGAFLLLTHVQSFFKVKSQELIQAFEDSNTLLFNTLDSTTAVGDTISSVLGPKTNKHIISYHGAWLKRYAAVTVHNRKASRIAFTGSERSDRTPNLYLVDTNSPLVVVGDTRLEGNSYLPKQGVKAGNISGTYYQGNNLYYGKAIESNETLPKLQNEWITYLEGVIKGSLVDNAISISLEDEIMNSFHKPIKLLYDSDAIYIGKEKIIGNVIIQSTQKIVIGPGAQLKDVLLIAPRIVIKNDVKGSFQAISTKNLEIGQRCYLSYPSSAILLDKNIVQKNTNSNQIQNTTPNFSIGSGTVIEGSVVYLKNKSNTDDRIKTHLIMAQKAEVVGEIYCQGNIDIQGIVRGSMYAKQCIARQSGSVYLNHIYNGKILMNPVKDYSGLPFSNSKNNIAKWLY